MEAFRQALAQLGWNDGRNARIDARWSDGDAALARKYAAELVTLAPDVILAIGGAHIGPLLQASRTVPMVFVIVPDPVGSGFVRSLARPRGNATGFIQFEYGLSAKWLELLKEVASGATRAAILWDPTIPAGIGQFAVIQSVASSLGVELSPVDIRDAGEIERDVADFARSGPGGMGRIAKPERGARQRGHMGQPRKFWEMAIRPDQRIHCSCDSSLKND